MPDNVKKKMFIYKNGRYVVPETPDLENIIGEAIEADKDILSQIEIEYDSDHNETTILFPHSIEPITLATDYGIYYFDYSNEQLKDEDGVNVGYCSISDEKCLCVFGGEVLREEVTACEYILYDSDIGWKDWYAILNPATPGTKLYKHAVNCGAYDFYIINKSSSLINTWEKTRNTINSNDTLHVNFSGPNDGGNNLVCNGSDGFAYLSDDSFDIVTDTLPRGTYTDTVTEL